MKFWTDYFSSLDGFKFAEFFEKTDYVWEPLGLIKPYLDKLVETEPPSVIPDPERRQVSGPVWIGENTKIEQGAFIKGPAWIGQNCQIRHNAYIREYSIIGDGSVVGNATEVKNSILLGHCEVPHFNYVGDSILGWKAHLGAGVVLSNFKQTSGSVKVTFGGEKIDTRLLKFGAILGDGSTVGCNSVLNPGSFIGSGSILYPNCNWRGYLGKNTILKVSQTQQSVEIQ